MPGLRTMRGRLGNGLIPAPTSVPTYILTAADGGAADTGWCTGVIGTVYGGSFGAMTGTPIVVDGKTIEGILWDFPGLNVWLTSNGASWSTGRSIWVDGVEYPFESGTDYSTYSYHKFYGSNLFTAGNDYTIHF